MRFQKIHVLLISAQKSCDQCVSLIQKQFRQKIRENFKPIFMFLSRLIQHQCFFLGLLRTASTHCTLYVISYNRLLFHYTEHEKFPDTVYISSSWVQLLHREIDQLIQLVFFLISVVFLPLGTFCKLLIIIQMIIISRFS